MEKRLEDQWVFVLDQWVFVLDHRVFFLDRVLGLRSSFLGLRFKHIQVLDPDPSGYFRCARYLNWRSSHVAKSAVVVFGDTKGLANQSFPLPLLFPSWPSYPRIEHMCQAFRFENKYFAMKLNLCNSFLYHCGYPVTTMIQKEGFCCYKCTFIWDKAWG